MSLIGGVDAFTVSTTPASDATRDVVTDYDLPAGMSGTGEVVDGLPLVRAVMAVEGDRTESGRATADPFTA